MFNVKGINVLSLFDGKSSGKTACDLSGIGVNKYYAAEIDKYANIVSNALYPNIIRLGDVTKWREWNINWASIDLLLGGFPCQAWSMAGKQQGDKDERGMLFWTMLESVLESVLESKYYHTKKALDYMNREVNGGRTHFDFGHHSDTGFSKSSCITANMFKGVPYNLLIDRDKTRCVNSSIGRTTPREYYKKNQGHLAVYTFNGEDPHLCRKLTPRECFRLQTVPEHLIDKILDLGVSNTQLYKIAGNGWTDEVIAHILRHSGLVQ